MKIHVADWKLAFIAAAGLDCLAAFVTFAANPGGFESQSLWLLILMPAALVAYPLLDLVDRLGPHADQIAFWPLMLGFNFLWYWGISYTVVKIFRRTQGDDPW
jgi:hypothetical protein